MADDHQLVAIGVSDVSRVKMRMNVTQSRRTLICGASGQSGGVKIINLLSTLCQQSNIGSVA